LGTGFIVNRDGWIVTARHVVEAAAKAVSGATHGGALRIGFAGPNIDEPGIQIRAAFIFRQAKVVAEDVDSDLALVQLPGDITTMFGGLRVGLSQVAGPEPRAVTLSTRRPREGTPVAISGYPIGEPSLVTTSGHIAAPWAFENVSTGKTADRYLADATANPGNSGGPAYSTEAVHLLGVCVAGRNVPIQGAPGLAHFAGLTVLVPASAVATLLDKHGVAWQAESVKQPQRRTGRK